MEDTRTMTDTGWFENDHSITLETAIEAIRTGSASTPADWSAIAVQTGGFDSTDQYYELLHEATIGAAESTVEELEQANDRQLIHAVRSYDTLADTMNELTEVVEEWAGSYYGETKTGAEYIEELADRSSSNPTESRIIGLSTMIQTLDAERTVIGEYIEQTADIVAPNLTMLAGPILTARLLETTGSLKALARKSSGTIQVLGAESALFAHLNGHAPSPKHGVIFMHTAVQQAPKDQRGKAARIVAGKLAIAARIDYYSGERRPSLTGELEDRLSTVRGSEAS